jgi:hypothetical protein
MWFKVAWGFVLLILAGGCGAASSPSVVGLGELGTGLLVAREVDGESAFYLCYPGREVEVLCRAARIRWLEEYPEEVEPFEPPPPDPDDTPQPFPQPQRLAPVPEIPE